MVRQVPSVMKEAFLYSPGCELTAEQMEQLFQVKELSVEGSNRRQQENKTLAFWRDFLLDGKIFA